jgi:uncharacterized membrane protein
LVVIHLWRSVQSGKNDKGKIKLLQAQNVAADGALVGGFWGSHIGSIFLNPILDLAAGATARAMNGSLTDVVINDKFIRNWQIV